MKTSHTTLAIALAFGLAASLPLYAQADSTTAASSSKLPTPAQVAGPAATQPSDQTVMLNPFQVTASKDVGYQATETLAGTRLRTNLGDVAASISVVDKQFLEDIGATDNGSLLEYVTDTVSGGTMGTYSGVGNSQTYSEQSSLLNPSTSDRVRGLTSADNARDYYITDIPWDSFNVGRIDLLRGPNSILYGLGSPAGIINATTNSADFYNHGQATMRTGSYGSNRATLDINRDLIPNVLAIRIDVMADDAKYQQQPAFQNQKRIYGTLRYDPQFFKNSNYHTSINVKYEHGEINANRPRLVPPGDSISAWWRPNAISASNPFGGMGQQVANNPYDPWQTVSAAPGNDYGLVSSATVNYQPWLADGIGNVQQPGWLMDGTSGQLYQIYGGYIGGGLDSNGNPLPVSSGLPGRGNPGQLFSIGSLPGAANNYKLPGYQYGQYKTQTLQDPSIFNFYNTLIDGPNKSETEVWNAMNIDVSETAFDNRYGLDLTFDRQRYKRAGEALLGYGPAISMDIQKNFDDYYLNSANNGETGTGNNPNFGRPFVNTTGGSGSSYSSDREVNRASLFAELRVSDLTSNDFLIKLLGKHRFNGVFSNEKYWDENRQWQMYANSQAWDGFWNGNSGATNAFTNRAPEAVIYLGSSLINASGISGAHIPGITSSITLPSGGVYVFNPVYQNYQVSPTANWTPPSSLAQVYPNVTTQLHQDSNPANYTGWSYFQDNLITDNGNGPLATLAEKSLRETNSYSGNYQGYFWNNALVATLGWRYDWVATKDVTAQQQPLDRNYLDLSPQDYSLPGTFPQSQIFTGHSVSGGGVLHLNDLLPHDPLPIEVSLTYDNSSNFQVTSVRRDVYGDSIANPTGKTKEYGIMLATKDNRYFLRVTKFDTKVANGQAAGLIGYPTIGTVIQQGLEWRNIFLYQLGNYTMDSANQPSYRNTWTNAYPNDSAAQAQADEDAAITGWNNIQAYLAKTGFFQAWNFTPTTQSVLVNRTTYLSNPSAYQPNPSTVYAYGVTQPQGFTVPADQESKGYEFDATASPLPNWRISFNAAEATAVQSNIGGTALSSLVTYLNSQLYNPDGSLTPAGEIPRYGGAGNAVGPSVYGPWNASYTLDKLQEGSDVSELRKWSYKAITNYTFDRGFLKGFGIGGGYRWQDRDVIGYPVLASTGKFDLSRPYYGPSLGYVDLWASYDFKIGHYRDKLQLNVYNVGKRNGLIPVSIEPDGVTWAAARIAPVEEWYVTNTIDF